MVATGHIIAATPPVLLVVPEPGCRWYLTASPFNPALVSQLVTGDRFTYPLGHASERETYRWNGASWDFVKLLPAVPAVASVVMVAPEVTP